MSRVGAERKPSVTLRAIRVVLGPEATIGDAPWNRAIPVDKEVSLRQVVKEARAIWKAMAKLEENRGSFLKKGGEKK